MLPKVGTRRLRVVRHHAVRRVGATRAGARALGTWWVEESNDPVGDRVERLPGNRPRAHRWFARIVDCTLIRCCDDDRAPMAR